MSQLKPITYWGLGYFVLFRVLNIRLKTRKWEQGEREQILEEVETRSNRKEIFLSLVKSQRSIFTYTQ